jgi:hypothetical protein
MKMISIEADEFRHPIANALSNGMRVVVWHQIPGSGGSQEWFLIQSLDQLYKIISKGRTASAFTAYEWIKVEASQVVDQIWLNQILTALVQEAHNHMLLICPITIENSGPILLTWVDDAGDVQSYFEKYLGSQVEVGRISSVYYGEIIRGYFPDEHGNPQSGPY